MKGKGFVVLILGLIALYLILSKGEVFAKIASTLGDIGLRGAAVLQGRETVKGVTS